MPVILLVFISFFHNLVSFSFIKRAVYPHAQVVELLSIPCPYA
nr:MAG TPA: hypothetical protein [Bacteriophage sp.]